MERTLWRRSSPVIPDASAPEQLDVRADKQKLAAQQAQRV
jgi:hypothetical protein